MKITDEARKIKAEKDRAFSDIVSHLENLGHESIRIGQQFENIGELITDIDKDFSKATGIINKKDLTLLFVATGLLCAKWLIMGQFMPLDFDFKHDPGARDRVEHDEGDDIAEEKRKKDKRFEDIKDESKNYSEEGYRTVGQIIFRPVPYDATQKTTMDDILKNIDANVHMAVPGDLGGKSKRWLTYGHDPILGWLFGTVNIMTRSVTFKPTGDTHKVTEKGIKVITDELTTFPQECYHAFQSYKEDDRRLAAAVFKQGLHLQADKYTKIGLPIPLIPLEKAIELLEKGWNSVEAAEAIKKVLKKIGKNAAIIGLQFAISFIINQIIKAIHLLLYDEAKDGDIRLYQVRTRKILLTANCISSASNILVSAGIGFATQNPLEGAKRLDIGGFIETIHRLVVDTRFIAAIKREYVQEKLYERIYDSDFNWLYQ